MPNAALPFTFAKLRNLAAANLTLLLAVPHIGAATTTLNATPPPTPAVSLSQPNGQPETSATRTIVLVGEKPFVGGSAGRPLRSVDLAGPAGTILGARIIDLTETTATLQSVQRRIDEIAALRPDAVLVLAGPTDEKAGTQDKQQTDPLQSFARRITESGTSVFVLPASTTVGAAESALLRIGATGAGPRVSYVDLGGELAGRPFEHALENIRRELDSRPAVVIKPPAPVATRRPAPAPTAKPEQTPTPETAATPAVSQPAETPAPVGPALPPALTREGEQPKKPSASEGTPSATTQDTEDARLRLSGPEATTATINMRPPAPLKQFSPRRPNPNAREDKKQPGFSR